MLRSTDGAARHLAPLRASVAGTALATLLRTATEPLRLERSFRLTASGLAHDRFLLSMPAGAAPPGLMAGLAALGLPASAQAAAMAAWPRAAFVHLGMDGDVLKLYLERAPGLAMDGGAGPPLYRAWKWQPATGALAEDRYQQVPPEQVSTRLAAVPAPLQPALRAMLAVLGAKPGWLFALDVLGQDQRRSLDLRCYDFGRCVGDIATPLTLAAAVLGTPPAALNAALGVHRHDALGHVALGLGRGGTLFLSVYAGAEPVDPAALA